MDKILRVELLSDSDSPILEVTYLEYFLFRNVQKTKKVYRHNYSHGASSWRFMEDNGLTFKDDVFDSIYLNKMFSVEI